MSMSRGNEQKGEAQGRSQTTESRGVPLVLADAEPPLHDVRALR
jgi:hypothetical protein